MSPLTTFSTQQPTPFLPPQGKRQPMLPANRQQVQFGSATQTATKLTFWQTINAMRKQLALGDKDSREVAKGLALKYGPDIALPAFFSVPIIGWAAGVLALPFLGWMERRGTKIIEEQQRQLRVTKTKPLYHALKLEQLWQDPPLAKAPKEGFADQKKDLASRMARTWNRFIETLFTAPQSPAQPKEPASLFGRFWHWVDTKLGGLPENADVAPALKAKLRIPLDEHKNPLPSPIFNKFKRFMNARESLHQKWYYTLFLKPVDWFYQKFPLPKVVKMITLLPKFSVLALFYLLKIKPRA